MARPRDSRSPAPAGSQDGSRRRHRDENRRDRDRRDDGRDFRRPSRSRSPDVRLPCLHFCHSFVGLTSSTQQRHRDRGVRYRERDHNRDLTRPGDRPSDRRDDAYYRSGPREHRDRDRDRDRDRRRSRDRYAARPRSPDRRRNRSRDSMKSYRSRDGSRDRVRSRREGTADSSARNSHQRPPHGEGVRDGPNDVSLAPFRTKKEADESSRQGAKPKPNGPQAEADKKAERLAKLEAWKKKKESETQKQKAQTTGEMSQAIKLLAEIDKKTSADTPSSTTPTLTSASPPAFTNEADTASPVQPYAGKFDPKSIAKKSAASRTQDASKSVLGSLGGKSGQTAAPSQRPAAVPATDTTTSKSCSRNGNLWETDHHEPASALPANRGKASGFGFGKTQADNDKLPNKRKIDLDEEDTIQRKLKKLPAFAVEENDDMPYADQDEDYDSGDNIAEDEEAAVAADRAAHERRRQAENQTGLPEDVNGTIDVGEQHSEQPEDPEHPKPQTNGNPAESTEVADVMDVEQSEQPEQPEQPAAPEAMEVDQAEEEDVDPLDAFMAGLDQTADEKASKPGQGSKKLPAPEAYFSDEDNVFDRQNDGSDNILAMANKRKKREMPTIDYSKLKLEPIRKNFWVEPAEISALSETEVADLRLELDNIKVKGRNVPKPVQKWAQCGLTRSTLDIISALGFEKPTTIQMQAIPALMSGRDVIGVAKTGSGKTLAFLLPMFRHIMDQPPVRESDGPIGLIISPTRELATQIHRDCKPFLKSMGLHAVCTYGGAPVRDQIADLKRGAEIIVCTPGRVIDILAANQGRVTNLKRATYVVLDEADRMFDMGFEPQMMKILNNMRPDRQTILFSATMPRLIDSLIKKVLKNPIEITVGGRSVVAKEIEQIVEIREESTKFVRTLELLGNLYDKDEDARSLIFVAQQEKADDLLKELMTKGYPCMSIHGGKDQVDRDSTISDFKNGVVPILIATSVAARGLDIKQLKLVINYDAPNHLEDYVHRAGRTGRAGNTGVAVTFVTPEQENCAPGIAKALEQSGQPVPEKLEEMRNAYREKVKSGSVKESSGFGGRGLDHLVKERELARQLQRRTLLGEGDDEEEKEEKTKDDEKDEKALSAILAAASTVQARSTSKTESEVKVSRSDDATAKALAKFKNPLDKVSSAVSAINSRLGKSGQLRSGQPIDNKGPDAGAFHATLEINDFPQKARWAVTNRTNVAKILDSTGTSITTKGSFYPAGKEVPPNADPKLYILIEGDTEVAVSSALQEMTRLLREATIAAVDADNRAPASGRYTVT
ncbi:Pre-mRNA-processing ATP-dependent RNA helicase PRP5 [Hirsutella minnesotensis 3608]|uniref:RNA helicase n=1 Tax=Hirsutella minnesotensis 3608 TaxID=1043627 RepID=A0A0F7ZTQ7_9HYPO|nr:Pre-mRNA-processing ATP-dependent RNA helicase PRP5 [Hirsutella minnesotensis 3608]